MGRQADRHKSHTNFARWRKLIYFGELHTKMRHLLRRSNEQSRQHAVPAGRRRCLEEKKHAVTKRLEVEHVVNAGRVLDVHEELHSEHGVDEHDEEQQQTDVEQRRQ